MDSTSYVYLPDGKVDFQARTNGVTTRYGYDGRGMISSVLHEKSGQSLASREYWRDNRDRIVAWKRGTVNIPNGMETGRGDRYAYDAEGQLTQASYRALNPEPWLTLSDPKRSDSFQYDALGNRYGSNRIASRGIYMDFTRRDNGLNQYQMWSPYSAIYHDDNWFAPWVWPGNGVMMADGWITASYNALNQPVAIGSQGLGSNFYWFWHDPLGRCVKRWLGNGSGVPTGPITYLYYDGWNLVQEGPNASTADRLYVHGGRVDEIVASKLGGQWYNHQYDARGHCLLLTNSSGAIQEQYDYDAFGMPYIYNAAGTSLGNSGGVGNRFLFTGREWIKDLRVYDYRHRMYQPELGRFLQPDPKQFEAADYNLYRYCHNDPVNKNDPTGLDVEFGTSPWVFDKHWYISVTDSAQGGRMHYFEFYGNNNRLGGPGAWADSMTKPSNYTGVNRHIATPEQDFVLLDALKKSQADPPAYNPFTANCEHRAKEIFNNTLISNDKPIDPLDRKTGNIANARGETVGWEDRYTGNIYNSKGDWAGWNKDYRATFRSK